MVAPCFEDGGRETYLIELAEYVKKNNAGLIILSSGGVRENELKDLNIEHIKIKYIRKKTIFNFFKSMKEIIKVIKSNKIDLIHAHSIYTTVLSKTAVILSLNFKIKTITTLHSIPRQKWLEIISTKLLNLYSDKVIALSEYAKQRLVNYGLRENKIKVIFNGIRPLQERTKKNSGKMIVGTCGRLTLGKGFRYFIEATRLIDYDIEYWIIGDGELRCELENQVKALGVEGKVKFWGFRKDVNDLFNEIDIFVLPTLWESFGLVIAEAMSIGKPVIATRVGAISEVVGDCGILIKPECAEEIAQAIRLLMRDERLRGALGEKGKERFYKNFTQEIMGKSTLEIYKEMIS